MLKEMLKSMVAAEIGIATDNVIVEEEGATKTSLLVEVRMTRGSSGIRFRTHIDREMAEDKTIKELAREVAEAFADSIWTADLDRKTVLSDAFISVVNAKSNREMLEQVTHRKVLDLAAVPTLEFEDRNGGKAVVKITRKSLESLGVSEDELLAAAYRNSGRIKKYRFGTMESFLTGTAEVLGDDALHEIQESIGLCVLTSDDGHNGAGAICFPDLLDKCASMVKSDIYIIPSSVHELMVVPAMPWVDPDDLREMVRDCNGCGSVVRPGDVLSNNVYWYSRKTKSIRIA